MKRNFTGTIFLSSVLLFNTSMTFASPSRVDEVINSDSDAKLERILKLNEHLSKSKIALVELQRQLSYEEQKESKRKIGIAVASISAVIAAMSIRGANNSASPIGSSLYYMQGLIAGASGVGAGAYILLNKNEAKKLRNDIKDLNTAIDSKILQVEKEKLLLCKFQPQHKVCY
ncbi:hypothetical protein DOM21_09220 [Bacteriovorax stolpii]|uniref:hypothetical protein n=1 Tax=Bacteriovorax stolpii TaxID=960 RepID=UPI001157E71F|nr:hypothetical protein [Bacteriovorax stolpii]QDK41628.1 hypothetical protein DOM21_09220 [Bacteriovorax stolpii]